MIKLNIRLPEYISPSTFLIADRCDLSAYIEKWAGANFRREQTMPMAVGSAFDSFIKAEIAIALGKPNKLAELLKTVELPAAITVGKELAEKYIEAGCLKRLLDQGLNTIEMDEKKDIWGVPVFCRLDAALTDNTPVDWKVNGYGSQWGASPFQGYIRRMDRGMNVAIPLTRVPLMEEINRDWAIQLLFYWWVLAPPIIGPARGIIEQVAIKGKKIEFVTYKAEMGPVFVQQIKVDLVTLWNRVIKGELKDCSPNKFICHPYSRPRLCTKLCPYYGTTLGSSDPVNRVLNG